MDIRSPSPPSPTASEPPPSYDSLTPTSQHPPYHTGLPITRPAGHRLPPAAQQLQHESAWELQEPLHATGLQQEAGSELRTIREEGIEYPPPPPYSPGLGNTLPAVDSRPDEGDAEPPPGYYSLFGQIQHARQHTSNNVAFLKRLCNIAAGSVGCTVLLVMLMLIPLTVLVLGIVYANECPLQPLVPVFLTIGGLSGIVKTILLLSENVVRKNSASLSSRVQHPKLLAGIWRAVNLAFNIFMLSWVIIGSYWIYSMYHEVVTTGYSTCDIVLYKFSFSFVTCSYVLSLLIFSWTLSLAISALRKRKARARSRSNGNASGAGVEAASPEGGETWEGDYPVPAEVPLSERVWLDAGISATRADSNVESNMGMEFDDRDVALNVDTENDTGMENAITATDSATVNTEQSAEQAGSLTRSSPQPQEPTRVTTASSPNLSNDPVLTPASVSANMTYTHTPSVTPTCLINQPTLTTGASPVTTVWSLHYPSSSGNMPPAPHLHPVVSSPHLTAGSSSHGTRARINSLPHLQHFSSTVPSSTPMSEPGIAMATCLSPPGLRTPLHTSSLQQSFGSNDTGQLSNPPRYGHTLTTKDMTRMVSCSAMHGPLHKDIVRHHSIPSLFGSRSCDSDPRGGTRRGSSLYNTVHTRGFSITAV